MLLIQVLGVCYRFEIDDGSVTGLMSLVMFLLFWLAYSLEYWKLMVVCLLGKVFRL